MTLSTFGSVITLQGQPSSEKMISVFQCEVSTISDNFTLTGINFYLKLQTVLDVVFHNQSTFMLLTRPKVIFQFENGTFDQGFLQRYSLDPIHQIRLPSNLNRGQSFN